MMLLLVKERVVSGFNSSRAVILMSRTDMAVEKKIFDDSELEALLAEDSCQTQEEMRVRMQ